MGQAIYGIWQVSLVDGGQGKGRLKIMTMKVAAKTLFWNLSPCCTHATIKPQQALAAFNLLIKDFETTAILFQKKSTLNHGLLRLSHLTMNASFGQENDRRRI
jgi:hypothetical protein